MLTFLFGKTTPSLIQIRFISTDFKSYLIKNCDFSHEKALFASRKLHFQSSSNPDAVLTLLTSYGFSHSDISKITARYPSLLLSNPDQTLKPKLDFFNSRGLSGDDLVKVISKDHRLLMSNLETTIIPCFDFLKTIIQTDDGIFTMLKRSTNILRTENEKTLAPKITLLRVHGVSDSNISKTLVSHPRVFTINISRFTEIIAQAKKMEFDPGQYTFLMAVNVLASMSKSSLEAKFDAYRSWGLSEDELRSAFRKTPNCMILSKESIMLKMDYFVNKMGYAPSSVAKQPSVLIYSLEKRIIPRCLVIQVLVTNGLVKKAPTLCSFLTWPEKMFLKYISRFGKEVTGLMDAYQKGKMNGFDRPIATASGAVNCYYGGENI